jgi:hypothetical protein
MISSNADDCACAAVLSTPDTARANAADLDEFLNVMTIPFSYFGVVLLICGLDSHGHGWLRSYFCRSGPVEPDPFC